MKSLRQAIQKSWFPQMTLIRGDLATSLGLSQPLSLTELTRHLDQSETISLGAPLDADALHGAVEVILRSDGTYTFRGHVRATGWPSFAYTVQVFIRSAGGAVLVALATSGRVFGTDTPGNRSKNWDESNSSKFIRDYWMALRRDSKIDTNLDKSLSGVSGGLVDIAKTVFETYLAAQTGGIIGAVIVLGSELGSATGGFHINPNILAGITVGAGILVVFGPSAIIPAVAAGTTTALVADIRFRRLNDGSAQSLEEIRRANEVFKGTLPIDRIVLTDLHSPDRYREFCYPAIDGSIHVNLGRNFDNPLGPDANPIRNARTNNPYAKPGSVLMHELTHAWQIEHTTFIPGLTCKALLERDYTQNVKTTGSGASWSSDFSLEQQGSIVDSWYSDWLDHGLDSPGALSDPRFKYISENIRRGQA